MLQAAARQAGVTVGLDTGPWLLAAAGLLDGRRATVHGICWMPSPSVSLGVEASRARVIRDGPILTCAGAMSALDLTLDLIAGHLGLAARLDVEALFLHGDPPVGETGAVTDPLVRRALGLMRDTSNGRCRWPRWPGACPASRARSTGISAPGLGAPPGTVYRQLRLSAARKLIEDSRSPSPRSPCAAVTKALPRSRAPSGWLMARRPRRCGGAERAGRRGDLR